MMSTLILEQLKIPLLKPIDISIAAGECISIMGESGSGKSLLLRAIVDLDPNQGEAKCGGLRRSSMSAPTWRSQVGLQPTETVWWFNTVGQHFNNNSPRHLDELGFSQEVMTWQIDRLSTGEKQRLGLLRLLDLHPQVLLLDEPTASLDISNRQRIEELIERYKEEFSAAVIWITHDQEQADRVSNRQFVIEQGFLKEHTLKESTLEKSKPVKKTNSRKAQ